MMLARLRAVAAAAMLAPRVITIIVLFVVRARVPLPCSVSVCMFVFAVCLWVRACTECFGFAYKCFGGYRVRAYAGALLEHRVRSVSDARSKPKRFGCGACECV